MRSRQRKRDERQGQVTPTRLSTVAAARVLTAPPRGKVTRPITIAGAADQDRPEWPITMTGMRIAPNQ
jgi:hypothetical protein